MALSSESSIVVAIASGAFLPANAKRQTLIIEPPLTNIITISKAGVAVAGVGLVIRPSATGAPIIIHAADFGDWMQNALNAISLVAPETIGVIEISVP
jgi:hypothetical protein